MEDRFWFHEADRAVKSFVELAWPQFIEGAITYAEFNMRLAELQMKVAEFMHNEQAQG